MGGDGFGFSLRFRLSFGSEWWWVLVFCWVCSGDSVVFCMGCGLVGDVGG